MQYASLEYTSELKERGFEVGVSRKGNPYDNATMESFFKTLKHEDMYLFEHTNLADVQSRLPYFIEQVYNLKRLHSSIGYLSPVKYEALVQQQQNKEEIHQPNLFCLAIGVQSSRILHNKERNTWFLI